MKSAYVRRFLRGEVIYLTLFGIRTHLAAFANVVQRSDRKGSPFKRSMHVSDIGTGFPLEGVIRTPATVAHDAARLGERPCHRLSPSFIGQKWPWAGAHGSPCP